MGESAERPSVLCLIAAKNVDVPVVALDPEVAMIRGQPAVKDLEDRNSPLSEPERPRFLFAAVTGIALDANFHCLYRRDCRSWKRSRAITRASSASCSPMILSRSSSVTIPTSPP